MTVSTLNNKVNYTGDGATTVFPYDFPVLDANHMFPLFDDVQQDTGYTVNGVGQAAGGDVTFDTAPASGVTVTLLRQVPETQETDYKPYDPFPAESHEVALDLLTMMIQQLTEKGNRTLIFPPSSDGSTSGTLPPPSPGKTLCWNEDGTALTNCTPCECPEPEPPTRRTMYGRINGADGATTKSGGDLSFTSARTGQGAYRITFSSPINEAYVVVMSIAETDTAEYKHIAVAVDEQTTHFDVQVRDPNGGAYVDRSWSFHLEWNVEGWKSLPLVNPGFETGDFTGWTIETGGAEVVTQVGNVSEGYVYAYEGTYFCGQITELNEQWRIASDNVDLVANGVSAALIDAGRISVEVRWAQRAYEPNNDDARAGIRFYESDGTTQIGATITASYTDPQEWTIRKLSAVVPPNARYVEIIGQSLATTGTYASGFIDSYSLWYRES